MRQRYRGGALILVLGIVSVVLLPPLGILTWALGHRARRDMAAAPGVEWTNRGLINAGWLMGIVASMVFLVLMALLVFLLVAISAMDFK